MCWCIWEERTYSILVMFLITEFYVSNKIRLKSIGTTSRKVELVWIHEYIGCTTYINLKLIIIKHTIWLPEVFQLNVTKVDATVMGKICMCSDWNEWKKKSNVFLTSCYQSYGIKILEHLYFFRLHCKWRKFLHFYLLWMIDCWKTE